MNHVIRASWLSENIKAVATPIAIVLTSYKTPFVGVASKTKWDTTSKAGATQYVESRCH